MNTQIEHPDDLLVATEAAKILRVSPQTLAIWRCQGRREPRFVRLSARLIRYRRRDLEEFVNSRACEQPTER